jgi:23S rRNA G2445 N2-methylase RlmL
VHRRKYRQKLSTAELAELLANPLGTLSHLRASSLLS